MLSTSEKEAVVVITSFFYSREWLGALMLYCDSDFAKPTPFIIFV